MDYFEISQKGASLHIEGFPEAVKVLAIKGHEAKRLADLALHQADLEFASSCLDAINQPNRILRDALWRSAVIHFAKCFGNGARFQLDAAKVYKNEPPAAKSAFDYFKNLRNKHIAHDENAYAQSIPGAVLNDGSKSYKIEKIVCLSVISDTLDQGSFGNLKLLVDKALAWVISEFDSLCERVTSDLERESYADLLAKDAVVYQVPTYEDNFVARTPPVK